MQVNHKVTGNQAHKKIAQFTYLHTLLIRTKITMAKQKIEICP